MAQPANDQLIEAPSWKNGHIERWSFLGDPDFHCGNSSNFPVFFRCVWRNAMGLLACAWLVTDHLTAIHKLKTSKAYSDSMPHSPLA
jgi:hypothetical protein